MSYSNTEKIGFWTVLAFFMLGPLIGITYALYSLVFWMINKGFPKALVFAPIGLVFGVTNVLHNFIVCTILFRELPKELFTTDRLKRWELQEDDTPRRELADMLGGFLNSQDEGHY